MRVRKGNVQIGSVVQDMQHLGCYAQGQKRGIYLYIHSCTEDMRKGLVLILSDDMYRTSPGQSRGEIDSAGLIHMTRECRVW